MNIFIIGDLRSAYRTDFYLQALMKLGYKKIYINSFSGQKILKGITNILMLLMSDVVFVAPLQHNNKLVKLAILLKKIIIVDFYISFYDSVVFDHKKYDSNSKKAQRFLKIDRNAANNARVLTFLNKSEMNLYLNRIGIRSELVNYEIIPLVIPNREKKAQLDFFKGKRKTMNICWVGTYIPLHGIDKIIEAVNILSNTNCDIHFYFWGNSNEAARGYIEKVKKLKIDNYVSFINDKWGNMEEWENFIVKNCDISLGVFGDSTKSKTVLPNKVIDGIVFKTPVITQFSKGAREFFDFSNDIFGCSNTPEELASVIEYIYSLDFEDIEKHIENSYLKYENNFSYEAFYARVEKVFEKVMDD